MASKISELTHSTLRETLLRTPHCVIVLPTSQSAPDLPAQLVVLPPTTPREFAQQTALERSSFTGLGFSPMPELAILFNTRQSLAARERYFWILIESVITAAGRIILVSVEENMFHGFFSSIAYIVACESKFPAGFHTEAYMRLDSFCCLLELHWRRRQAAPAQSTPPT